MWYLIFLFVCLLTLMLIVFPFLISYEIKINLLRLKGVFTLIIFSKIKLQFKLRVKNGYIYIYHNRKEKRYKLTDKNFNVIFFVNLIKQLYFRHQLCVLDIFSNFGYMNDACVSAVGVGYIDVISKCVLSKIKNNKKSAHIFVNVDAKYNQDICSIRVKSSVRVSIWDLLFSIAYTLLNTWRYYEKHPNNKLKQKQ